jgi:cobalt-zinc-cadmium efflux system outer membrane protein
LKFSFLSRCRFSPFFLLPLIFIFTASSRAESTLPEPEVPVEELIARALKNNPQPVMARANLEAARRRAIALKSLPNPILQVVPGFFGSDEARDEEIILSQPLDLFGHRRAQRKVLDAESRRALSESTLVTRALVVEVKKAAANLFAAQEAESLGVAQVEVAQKFRDAAARKAVLGDVPPVQVQRAELELLRVENELTNARAERLVRRAVLNQLIGQAPETPLKVKFGESTSTPVASTAIFSQRAALLSGLINRPDIVGAQATLEARRAQVNAIGKQRLPQVELQARRSAVFGSGDVAVRAVITAPLFDFGSIKNEKRAAQAEVQAQESQIEWLKTQAASQVEQALIRLEQQRATVARYRSGIVPQTLDLLRKTQIGFDAGASTYLEVLESQRTLRAVQAEYLQALVGVRTSEAQLESALGATLPENLLGTINNPQGASTPDGVAAPGTVPPLVNGDPGGAN